jgi:hypothetical protein
VALVLLVHDHPHHQRGKARRRLARELANTYVDAGREIPAWLAAELEP